MLYAAYETMSNKIQLNLIPIIIIIIAIIILWNLIFFRHSANTSECSKISVAVNSSTFFYIRIIYAGYVCQRGIAFSIAFGLFSLEYCRTRLLKYGIKNSPFYQSEKKSDVQTNIIAPIYVGCIWRSRE